MFSDSTTLRMIDRIYQAAIEPSHWFEFAKDLSSNYDDAVVIVGMELDRSGLPRHHFTAGAPADLGYSLLANFIADMPFDPFTCTNAADRFATIDTAFPDRVLEESDVFRQFMHPHGFAPVWPIWHWMGMPGQPGPAVLAIFRKQGAGPFTADELALGRELIPHLSRSFEIYSDLSMLHRSRMELDEVIDRLRIGVILTDTHRRPVLMNRSAKMMVEIGETIEVRRGRIRACASTDDGLLQSVLEAASKGDAWQPIRLGEDSTPKHGLQVLANPLTAAPAGSQARDAVAALFISGSETFSDLSLRYLRQLHGLTTAEAGLVAQLAGGASLEEAAEDRGIAVNTARSQLKRAFSKTDCHSQSEIVQLVLECISPVHEV